MDDRLLSFEEAYQAFPALQELSLETMWFLKVQLANDVDHKKLAASLIHLILKVPETSCLLITERGIWPSSEWLFPMQKLFEAWSGETTDFWDTPGVVFGPADAEWIEAFLFLSQASIWGFRYTTLSGEIVLEIDHHETMWLYARDRESLSEIIERLRGRDFRPGWEGWTA